MVSCRGYVLSRDVVHNLVHTIAGFSLQPETQPGEHDLVNTITTTHKTFQMRRHRHAAGTQRRPLNFLLKVLVGSF